MNPTDEIRVLHRGAVRTSDWVTGHPPRVRTRPVPPGCRMIAAGATETLPDATRARVDAILAKHPRVKWVIAYVKN